MKTIRTLLFAILLGSLLSACGGAAQSTPTPFAASMKGYELYSWQEGGQWKFSVLIGTNREKTLDEIKSADVVLSGSAGPCRAIGGSIRLRVFRAGISAGCACPRLLFDAAGAAEYRDGPQRGQ